MPTVETLFLLALSIPAMESADSIRSLYRHFLSGITKKSLNAFYYACSYAKVDYSRFMNVTAGMALKLIPEKLQSQPVFLCIDDTMILQAVQKLGRGIWYGKQRAEKNDSLSNYLTVSNWERIIKLLCRWMLPTSSFVLSGERERKSKASPDRRFSIVNEFSLSYWGRNASM